METNLLNSFTAASNFPLKIFLNNELLKKIISERFIPPWHIQLNPTSKCQQECGWCSCKNRDRTKVLNTDNIFSVFDLAIKLGGGKATTLTGDGDPLLHPDINEIIVGLHKKGVDIGIVNNGWSLPILNDDAIKSLTWMRVSLGDGQKTKTDEWWAELSSMVKNKNVDFSFSYVLTSDPDLELIVKAIKFANTHQFTHVRIVNNIFVAKQLSNTMLQTRSVVRKKIDDKIAIWQGRDE